LNAEVDRPESRWHPLSGKRRAERSTDMATRAATATTGQSVKPLTTQKAWKALQANKTTREAAVADIARRYREFVDVFESGRGKARAF
jgi:hypothetical protein